MSRKAGEGGGVVTIDAGALAEHIRRLEEGDARIANATTNLFAARVRTRIELGWLRACLTVADGGRAPERLGE